MTEQPQLTAAMVLEDMTPEELERAELVESLLPALRDQAAEADRLGTFLPRPRSSSPNRGCSAWSCRRSTAASVARCAT